MIGDETISFATGEDHYTEILRSLALCRSREALTSDALGLTVHDPMPPSEDSMRIAIFPSADPAGNERFSDADCIITVTGNDHVTYLDAGRTAQDEGAAAITLHGRTADQLYSGTADWSHIARLVEAVDIPVLGNGDIGEADDALRMVAETGCAGVVIGRGCLGRPWLFGDLAAAFAGTPQRGLPSMAEVAAIMHRHATLLAAEQGELHGCTDFRKHVAWYLKGFSVGSERRAGR